MVRDSLWTEKIFPLPKSDYLTLFPLFPCFGALSSFVLEFPFSPNHYSIGKLFLFFLYENVVLPFPLLSAVFYFLSSFFPVWGRLKHLLPFSRVGNISPPSLREDASSFVNLENLSFFFCTRSFFLPM